MLNFIFVELGVPQQLAKLVAAMPLPPWGVMLLIIGFYLALGTFMEGFSMVITTIPVVFPVVLALGYDPIWFGVIVTMLVEIALISPPDGTVLYVLQGMRKDGGPITDIFSGVMPFMLVYILALLILMWFPRDRALAAAGDEVQAKTPPLMVRSAAKLRVSNHGPKRQRCPWPSFETRSLGSLLRMRS